MTTKANSKRESDAMALGTAVHAALDDGFPPGIPVAEWDFDGYWNVVLGDRRDAEAVCAEFDLDPRDRHGLDAWLGEAEVEAWKAGACGGDLPDEWREHHTQALDALNGVAYEAVRNRRA